MALTFDLSVAGQLEARWGEKPLLRYVFQPRVPARESPRPYFHPVWTLAGDAVTLYRPYDHPHHHGISMTCACLSGQNFWGGPSYIRAENAYRDIPNWGVQRHVGWASPPVSGELPRSFIEDLEWITHDGKLWLREERSVRIAEVNEASGYWSLDVELRLRNVSGRELRFGSPTTEGRPLAGYGGFFWRGPRSFHGGKVLASGGLEGAEKVMGQRAPWLAYTGRHDETQGTSTLVFLDHPSNPRHPTQWFVRNADYAGVCAAFMFDQEYVLMPAQPLHLRYRIGVGAGARDADFCQGVHDRLEA